MDPDTRSSAVPSFGAFTDWAIRSPANYSFTIVLLFSLGLLGRFLGALKAQFERRWSAQSTSRSSQYTRHQNHIGLQGGESEEFQLLKPEASITTEKTRVSTGAFWTAEERWNVKRDGVRALLEFARALIAYTLMLAVMTYDVGFFFSVTGSVFAGEFVFGRYSRSAHG